jgi:pilus assembly protein Flp/PilA
MLTSIRTTMTKIVRDEQGATAIEYGMIAGLVAVVIIPALLVLGPKLLAAFNSIAGAM